MFNSQFPSDSDENWELRIEHGSDPLIVPPAGEKPNCQDWT